jgi:hypothetical protein
MATYKVPQDVEADDKLIGPFTFRQFIYLIIVALAIALAWGLGQVFFGLAIIPLPIILLFGALALPLRKDQPMEIYLAAIVSFYLKPRKRKWEADGIESLIEITVPKVVEVHRTKDITEADAEERFSYLANIVDSQGWAIRGTGVQTPNSAINSDVFLEAQSAQDVLDNSNSVAQTFEQMMNQRSAQMRDEAVERMHQAPSAPTPPVAPAPNPYDAFSRTASQVNDPSSSPTFNPYPTSIQQTVIQPVNDPGHSYIDPSAKVAAQTPPTTSDKPVSADIMNLANNTDLSIETIAHEAHRIQAKENDMTEEVVISLR